MRIVIFTQFLKSGGAEKRASIIANYLFANGIDAILITGHPVNDEYEVNPNIQRYYLAKSEDSYLKMTRFERLKSLKRILLDLRPDKIISFLTTYGFYAVLATRFNRKLRKIETIYSISNYRKSYTYGHRVIDWLNCLLSKRISLQCKEQIKPNKIFRRKCFVSYNPVTDNYGELVKRDFNKLSFISVGRLVDQKDHSFEIRAISKLHDKYSNVTLDIYGYGPEEEMLKNLLKDLHAEDYIKIHPFSFSIKDEYLKYSFYISSSLYEGFPNTLIEAMMSGLVCFSKPCPSGPKEIINNGFNGFLYKDEQQLIDQVDSLAKNIDLSLEISENARNTVKTNYEDKVVLPKYLDTIINN